MLTAPLCRALSPRTALGARCALLAALPGTMGHHGEDGTWSTLAASWPQCRNQSLPRISLLLLVHPRSCMMLSCLCHAQDQSAEVDFQEISFGKGSIQCCAPQKCNSLAFTELKQCFYKRDGKHRFDLLAAKLLIWWKGAESLRAAWAPSPEGTLRAAEQSWYLSSCVWKCLIDLEAQNFNTVLFCIDRGLWSHLNALVSIHTRI